VEITIYKIQLFGRLSGSDISKLCKKAKYQSIQRIQQHKHFVQVHHNGELWYQPCLSSRPGAINITLNEISGKILNKRVLTKVYSQNVQISIVHNNLPWLNFCAG